MKKISIFLVVLCQVACIFSQRQPDSLLYIGKKGNIMRDEKISPKNLGKMFTTYYYPIYYKAPASQLKSWRKVGLVGQHIAPYLSGEESRASFEMYRKYKMMSYAALPLGAGSLVAWAYMGGKYNWEHNQNDPTWGKVLGAYVRPASASLLLGYFACFYGGMYLNTRADLFLKEAIDHRNAPYLDKKKTSYKPYIDANGIGISARF
jgi:hypothetical protein